MVAVDAVAGGSAASSRRGRRVDPRSDRSNQPIAPPQHIRDIGRLLWIVTEAAPELRHRVVDRVRCNDDVLPDLVEELLDAHDLTGAAGQTNQEPHGPRLELDVRPVF